MPFKKQVNQVYHILEELKSLHTSTYKSFPVDNDQYKILTNNDVNDGIVLKSDTFLELGGPFAGSVAMTLQTNDESLVLEDKITLIGEDIYESETAIPFGQLILVSGQNLSDEDYLQMARIHSSNGYFKGYMVKSNGNDIWIRISNTLANSGFCFTTYGNAMIEIVKNISPSIKHVEVIFITSKKEDLKFFQKIAEDAKKIYQKIKEDKWLTRGVNIYDCAFHGNCSSCGNKKTCNEIQKMTQKRK